MERTLPPGRRFPPFVHPSLKQKVEEMKKVGAPTEEASKALIQTVEKLQDYHTTAESIERKVHGSLRNGFGWRFNAVVVTVASTVALLKVFGVAENYIERSGK